MLQWFVTMFTMINPMYKWGKCVKIEIYRCTSVKKKLCQIINNLSKTSLNIGKLWAFLCILITLKWYNITWLNDTSVSDKILNFNISRMKDYGKCFNEP